MARRKTLKTIVPITSKNSASGQCFILEYASLPTPTTRYAFTVHITYKHSSYHSDCCVCACIGPLDKVLVKRSEGGLTMIRGIMCMGHVESRPI